MTAAWAVVFTAADGTVSVFGPMIEPTAKRWAADLAASGHQSGDGTDAAAVCLEPVAALRELTADGPES